MNQQEKNKLSKEKILHAAFEEFGRKNYEAASLNTICIENNISKGLIYHYFKNKDDLYLCCVRTCFDALTGYLHREINHLPDSQRDMNHYLNLRYCFFSQHPLYSSLFFHTVLYPPVHLKDQVREIRSNYDTQCLDYYKTCLQTITLRPSVTMEEALDYFFLFQEAFNGCFQSRAYENYDFHSLIEAHEMKLSKILNIMLYGIAKENTEQ